MASTLKFEPYAMPAASLGACNPLPDFGAKTDIHAELKFDDSVPERERRFFTYGKVNGILPYLFQDNYDRVKRERAFKAAILENEYLKAVFMPEIGGRLWSLYDKQAGRDLLHVNPVFQPANLALRNAWFSGGVEWNIGMTGHTPFTCSPLFTVETALPDGTPVLRMYEWERIRRVSYQIDAWLPEGSQFLYVRIKLCNTNNKETPMYWWSNVAVTEAEDVRVISPAESAYWFDYHRVVNKRPVPVLEGIDRSYTTRVPHSMDTFFDLDQQRRKWITAVNGEGFGLIQTSTDRLLGRKLFMWGNGAGGKHWQEFLAVPGTEGYIEIQAGLAKTQMQHIPMPALARWEWLEAYGAISVCPEKAHGAWTGAYEAVEAALEAKLPRAGVDAELKRVSAALDAMSGGASDGARGTDKKTAPDAALDDAQNNAQSGPVFMLAGSGWAALEKTRLAALSQDFPVDGLAFDESSLDGDQAPWLELLRTGALPNRDPAQAPAAYLVQDEWREMLEASIRKGLSDNWHAWLQLGVMHYAAGDAAAARADMEKSIELTPSAWAYRNLSVLYNKDNNPDKALSLMEKSVALKPILPIAIEYARLLLEAGQYGRLADFIEGCAAGVRENWRLQIMKAQAAIHLKDYDAALAVLNADLTANDMREGEVLLSDMWVQVHRQILIRDGAADSDELDKQVLRDYPLPKHLDFRMRT